MPDAIRQSDTASPTQQNNATDLGERSSAGTAPTERIETTEIMLMEILPFVGPEIHRAREVLVAKALWLIDTHR
jgi:hypothetical protein